MTRRMRSSSPSGADQAHSRPRWCTWIGAQHCGSVRTSPSSQKHMGHLGRAAVSSLRGTVLVVDDELGLLRAIKRALERHNFLVTTHSTAAAALECVAAGGVDVVVTDISLPGMSGLELLQEIRRHDPDLPVILMTGVPGLDSAREAIDHGVLKYLVKPVETSALLGAVTKARQLVRMGRLKREALSRLSGSESDDGGRDALAACFERTLESMWVAYQPIVRAGDGTVFGYEALLRSREPGLPGPGQVLEAAERLGEVFRLGRTVRDRAGKALRGAREGTVLFVNLHPEELADPELVSWAATLSGLAPRVVLEVTERASLDGVKDLTDHVSALRTSGFRIAVDDLGAGYAGLTTFTLLEPEVVKIDMALIRDIDSSPVKQKVVASVMALCRDMGQLTVAEGVETAAERDSLVALGCDLLQGYLFARPGVAFPEVRAGALS